MPAVFRPCLAVLAAAWALGAAGCASTDKTVAAPAAVAEPVRREDFITLLGGGVPEELKNRLEVRGYAFAPGESPRVAMEIYNPSETAPLSFEVRTLFFRDDSSLVDATEWTAGQAAPRRSFLYRAQSFSPWATREQVQLRMVRSGAGS